MNRGRLPPRPPGAADGAARPVESGGSERGVGRRLSPVRRGIWIGVEAGGGRHAELKIPCLGWWLIRPMAAPALTANATHDDTIIPPDPIVDQRVANPGYRFLWVQLWVQRGRYPQGSDRMDSLCDRRATRADTRETHRRAPAGMAREGRASDCGPQGRWFKSRWHPTRSIAMTRNMARG